MFLFRKPSSGVEMLRYFCVKVPRATSKIEMRLLAKLAAAGQAKAGEVNVVTLDDTNDVNDLSEASKANDTSDVPNAGIRGKSSS